MELIIPLLFLVVLWFLLIRPQQKRQKEHAELVRNLAIGDAVVTISGLYGEVTALTDDAVDLDVSELASGETVVLRFQRGSIGRVIRDEDESDAEHDDTDDAEDADES